MVKGGQYESCKGRGDGGGWLCEDEDEDEEASTLLMRFTLAILEVGDGGSGI